MTLVCESNGRRALPPSAGVGPNGGRGAAAVEFAIILPVLLLILFGIVEVGVALYDKAVITNASREAVRAGVVFRVPKLTANEITNVAENYCSNHLVTFGGSTTPSVVVQGAQGNFGNPLTVTVTYTFSGLGFGPMLSAIVGPLQMNATTVMNQE